MPRFVLAALICTACGPDVGALGEAEPLARRAEALRIDDDGIIIMNGLPPEVLGENYLLNDEANRQQLISAPLASASFSGTLAAVKYDARAATVLRYLVRCALAPSDPAVVVAGQTFRGQLGLCRDWASEGIDANLDCQERVTACLLGLSNAAHAHVPVSMRGVDGALEAAPSLRPYPFTSTGALHEALQPCATDSSGVAWNCGWQPVDDATAESAGLAKVFSCQPGSEVRVGAGSSCGGIPLGSMTPGSDKVLRVCEGVGPCLGPTSGTVPPGFLGQSDGACGTWRPEVRFTCPASGQYIVMQRDYRVPAGGAPRGTMTVGHWSPAPHGWATEAEAFKVREGAFFGTLFRGPLGRSVKLSWLQDGTPFFQTSINGPVVFPNAYSCEDAQWFDELAYRTARLCTLSTDQCVSAYAGVCQGDATHEPVCALYGPVASGSFNHCVSPDGLLHDNALTTFLRTPCDLLSAAGCERE
ncbi:MAG: hypothetical protein ACOZQL_22985 [Myxococcota bacterium]